MNKLSKILLAVIIILVIALVITLFAYFDVKKAAKENLNLYLKSEERITNILKDNAELQNTTSIE